MAKGRETERRDGREEIENEGVNIIVFGTLLQGCLVICDDWNRERGLLRLKHIMVCCFPENK